MLQSLRIGQATFNLDLYPRRSFAALSPEAEELAAACVAQKVVPAKYDDDALHVAIAAVSGIQLIVSGNFKHLVSFQREAGFNRVNLLHDDFLKLRLFPRNRTTARLRFRYSHPSPDGSTPIGTAYT